MTTWTPTHPSTKPAWLAVVNNLRVNRVAHDGWGSRTVAVSIARDHGLTPGQAADLIRSALNHDYLEQRIDPISGDGFQVRLTDGLDGYVVTLDEPLEGRDPKDGAR